MIDTRALVRWVARRVGFVAFFLLELGLLVLIGAWVLGYSTLAAFPFSVAGTVCGLDWLYLRRLAHRAGRGR